MNDRLAEQQESRVQPPSQPAADESIATHQDAVETWNREEADRLLEEANALVLYVSRYGDSLSAGNGVEQEPHKTLLKAITEFQKTRSPGDWEKLMSAYAALTAVTYKERGVNGRTILDTQTGIFEFRQLFSSRYRSMTIGVIFFVLALPLEVFMRWSSGVSDAAALTGFWALIFPIVNTLSSFLLPALWGGIGACIFLAKRISDKLFDMAYEEARMRGGMIRIFLGSMLGVVTVVLFFPDFREQMVLGELTLAPAMVAFIAGLGVKPVYAAFESISEELARRFKGSDAGRQA